MKQSSLGKLGEDISCRYLIKRGYRVVSRNFSRPWGEIDIVAEKNGVLFFVEVKTKKRSSFPVAPEDQVGYKKKLRLRRIIETYFNQLNLDQSQPFRVDVLAIELDLARKKSTIRHIKNIEFN